MSQLDQDKVEYFKSRFAQLGADELAEILTRRDTLADEANAALDEVMAAKGLNFAVLKQFTPEIAKPTPVIKPTAEKRVLRFLGIFLLVSIGVFFAKAFAVMTPHWLGIIFTIVALVVWGVVSWGKRKGKRKT